MRPRQMGQLYRTKIKRVVLRTLQLPSAGSARPEPPAEKWGQTTGDAVIAIGDRRSCLMTARGAQSFCFAAVISTNSASGWLTMVATQMPLMISDQAVFQ